MTECSSHKWAQWTQLCSCRRLVQQETQLAKHKALLLHISTEQDIWEEHVLRGAYFHKLLEKMKSELGAKELPASLNAFISLSIRVDYHMQKNSIRGRTTNPRGLHVGQLTGPAPFPWRKCSVENSPCSCLSISPAHWGR